MTPTKGISPLLKISTILLMLYCIIAGFLLEVPKLEIIHESIRNMYYHVPMWFVMFVFSFAGVVYSLLYLLKGNREYDINAASCMLVATVFGVLGLVTGMIWATYTWGEPWSGDTKQTMTLVCLLIFLAYFVLRAAIDEEEKRAKLSAVYSIFAFSLIIPLLYIIPRQDPTSLHPGSEGNPAVSRDDADSRMLMVFYPAVIAWMLLSVWIVKLLNWYQRLRLRILEREAN